MFPLITTLTSNKNWTGFDDIFVTKWQFSSFSFTWKKETYKWAIKYSRYWFNDGNIFSAQSFTIWAKERYIWKIVEEASGKVIYDGMWRDTKEEIRDEIVTALRKVWFKDTVSTLWDTVKESNVDSFSSCGCEDFDSIWKNKYMLETSSLDWYFNWWEDDPSSSEDRVMKMVSDTLQWICQKNNYTLVWSIEFEGGDYLTAQFTISTEDSLDVVLKKFNNVHRKYVVKDAKEWYCDENEEEEEWMKEKRAKYEEEASICDDLKKSLRKRFEDPENIDYHNSVEQNIKRYIKIFWGNHWINTEIIE